MGEWGAMMQGGYEYIVKVKKYKTMVYGSAEFILSSTEDKALRAYMQYRRIIVNRCKKDSCPVFISITDFSPSECCIRLPLTNVTSILRKVALAAVIRFKTEQQTTTQFHEQIGVAAKQ